MDSVSTELDQFLYFYDKIGSLKKTTTNKQRLQVQAYILCGSIVRCANIITHLAANTYPVLTQKCFYSCCYGPKQSLHPLPSNNRLRAVSPLECSFKIHNSYIFKANTFDCVREEGRSNELLLCGLQTVLFKFS